MSGNLIMLTLDNPVNISNSVPSPCEHGVLIIRTYTHKWA